MLTTVYYDMIPDIEYLKTLPKQEAFDLWCKLLNDYKKEVTAWYKSNPAITAYIRSLYRGPDIDLFGVHIKSRYDILKEENR
jgi:hypothetical protein